MPDNISTAARNMIIDAITYAEQERVRIGDTLQQLGDFDHADISQVTAAMQQHKQLIVDAVYGGQQPATPAQPKTLAEAAPFDAAMVEKKLTTAAVHLTNLKTSVESAEKVLARAGADQVVYTMRDIASTARQILDLCEEVNSHAVFHWFGDFQELRPRLSRKIGLVLEGEDFDDIDETLVSEGLPRPGGERDADACE